MNSAVRRPDIRLGRLLRRAYRSHVRALNAALDAEGVTTQHVAVIVALYSDDGLDQTALSREIEVEKAALTSILKALEVTGVLRRAPHSTDGRRSLIFLTEKGRGFAERYMKIVTDVRDQALAGLEPKQLEALAHGLERVIFNLADEGR